MTASIDAICESHLQKKLHKETWGLIAYGGLGLTIAARIAKYTGCYLTGKTPPKQPYLVGVNVAMLFPVIECLSIRQSRVFLKTALAALDIRDGLGSKERKARWTTTVEGKGWKGFWIPFQDQLEAKKGPTKAVTVEDFPVGGGCDVVVMAIHGGGYIDGHALMFLDYFKSWMKNAQQEHNLRVGILSVEYDLCPESSYPGPINECVAAYTSLVKDYGVDSKRILLMGDSAGGNVCLGTSLTLRDTFAHLGPPAGHILVSPWVRSPEPLESSLFDFVSAIGCEVYAEAYTKNDPEHRMSPYSSPFSAPTLAGMAPMLIFIGGVEILRPSLEQFVEKAKGDEVEVQAVVGEDRSHNWFLMKEVSTAQDRVEAYRAMTAFALEAHKKFTRGMVVEP